MTQEIIIIPKGPPNLPRIGTRQSNTLHSLANVPVSVSEEEGTQMESEDEEKDSKAATDPTTEGKVPCVSPPIDEEDDKEDNEDNDNDKKDDNNDDGNKEGDDDDEGNKEDNDDNDNDDDEEGDNDNKEYTNDDDKEGIFDFDLNDVKGMSQYELLRLWRIRRNEARLGSLGLLEGMKSAASTSAYRTNRKKRVATQGDFVRRIQPKRDVSRPTSYKDLDDDPVISKRTRSIDSSDTGEEDTGSKRMDEVEYSPSGGDDEEDDDKDKLESYDDDSDDELDRRFRQAKAEAAGEALADPSLSTGHSTDIYGHSQQYYLHQKKYVAFLQALLSDTKRFPGFPKDSDQMVIVDTHPDYAPPHKNEVIRDNKCRGTYGDFSSILQRGPIFNKNGKASCFTFEQMLQSLKWINPVYSLGIINHSDDIPPSQVPFKDEHGNDFCTKINLLDKYTLEEKREEYELRTQVMKWVFIDAHHEGYEEYIALLYGKNPQTYWHPLIKDAYAMAMSYYNKEQGTNKFIDLSFVNITHFSAVMHPQDHETLVEMDVSMAKFANVNVDSVRYFQTTDFTHLHRMRNLIDYIRSVYRDLGRDTRLMTLPQDGTPLHISMIECFTRFRDDILQRAKLTCFEELTVFHLLSYMGKKGYENGLGVMTAEERMAAYENGLGVMSAEERMAAYENGIGAMSVEERMAASANGYENGLGAMPAEERMAASAAAKAAKRDAKWTAEVDALIERMIDDGVSFSEIASKLGNGLKRHDIKNRWYGHLKELSGIIKPLVKPGPKSSITWTVDDDASIARMRGDNISYAKIALKLGNGLNTNNIKDRWNRHLKDKLQ